jgi:outer membrane protein OmpA-like peptidoglycan-associated protein
MSVLILQEVCVGAAGDQFQLPVTATPARLRGLTNACSMIFTAAFLLCAPVQASEFSGSWAVGKAGNNVNSPQTDGTSDALYPAVEVGYGWDVEYLLLGVNANLDLHRKSITGVDYGVEMKLGLPKGNWLPYGKLGLALSSPGNRTQGGFGVEYKFKPQWSVSGEWQTDSKHVAGVDWKNSNFTVGLNFYFDQPKALPAVASSIRVPAPVEMTVVAPKVVPVVVPVVVPIVAPVVVPEVAPKSVALPVVAAVVMPPPTSVKEELAQNIAQKKPFTVSGEASFAKGSTKLLKAAIKRLNEVAKYAKLDNKTARIEITGHTDSRGPVAGNLKLSNKRAEAVKSYFVKQGIKANRITAKGYGSDKPIADNSSAAGRATNRRVEIRFINTP